MQQIPDFIGDLSAKRLVLKAHRRRLNDELGSLGIMRGILFRPIHIPGLRRSKPSKPRSLRFSILVVAWSIALLLVLLGGIYVTTYVITFLWTISAEPTPKSIEDLPLWMIPVCMLTPVFLVIATAWRFRLFERLLRSIKKENELDA